MAQRARRTRKRNTKKGGKVKVVIISIVAIALAVTAVFAATHFYKTTENNLEKSAYPLEYTDLVNKAAKEYNLQPALIYGVIQCPRPSTGSRKSAAKQVNTPPRIYTRLR